MRYWFTLIFWMISLINETILQSIIIRRIQTEVFQNTITSPVPSSLEGHALINIQGSGFSSITKSFACIFNSPTSNRFNYTMVVNKGQSVCAFNDYECNYQITHASLSENMIACYSPRINEADRQALLDEGGYLKLSVQVDGIPIAYSCSNTRDCFVYYHPNYTPYLYTLEPSHFYIGQNLTIKLTPRAAVTDNLIGIKLDRFNCFLAVPDGYTEVWNDLTLNCTTGGDFAVQKVTNFTVGYASGFSTIPSYFLKQDVDPTLKTFSSYYFKTFPRIDQIGPYLSGVTTGGHYLIIKGAGFQEGKTRVFIDKDECEIQKYEITVLTQTITCKVKPSSYDPLNPGLFIGSRGLRQRVFNVNTIAKMINLPGFPNNKTNMTKEDVLLETSTPPTGNNNYAQILYGYFKAVFTGQYRFWITSDDTSQVFLSNDTNPANKSKIIDFNGWSNFLDFVSQTPVTRSDWITLTAGNYYYFEVLHSQGTGGDHMRLGVEINQSAVNSSLPVLPNQIYKILNVSIVPKASRDLYEFRLTLNDTFTLNYNLPDGTVKKVSFNSSMTAENFRRIVGAFAGENKLIVRKLGYNENNQYFLNSNETLEDSSYTTNYNFSDMFLASPSSGNSPSSPSTNGTKNGVVFLVFIDKKASDRTIKWENIYYLTKSGSSNKFSIVLKQVVSPEVTGTFRLKVKDNKSGVEYESQDLNVSLLNNFQSQLELIPHLTAKVSVYVGAPDVDTLNLFLRLNTYADLNITVSNNTLSGGRDPDVKPTVNIADFVPNSKNLFYMPIPSDFLYMINSGPQVSVIVNGFEAVCPKNNCTYTYIPASSRPTVLSYIFDSNSSFLSIVVDKSFNDSTILPYVRIGKTVIESSNLNYTDANKTFTCKVPQNAIGGKYIPVLTTDNGECSYPSNLTQMTLPIIITSCTPTSANSLGGDVITITGSGFPNYPDEYLSVTIGGASCRVQGINNTQLNCTLGSQVTGNSDLLTISYYNVTASAPDTIFKYVTPAQPPTVASVTPNNLSPGEKQFMAIKFDSNITSFPLSGMSIKLVHNTLNTTIMLNPRNVTNNDTLFVRYGGAAPGEYTLYIKLDSVTYAKGSPKIISGYTITSISPIIGSVNGGTTLTIKGTNFLSTQVNQMIFIGKTTCVYVTNNNTDITCTTQAPNVNTPLDTYLPIAIDQMIQYTSICSVPKPSTITDPSIIDGCLFKYSTEKTAVINSVESKNNDYIFELNDSITINGANLSYTVAPTTLSFDWGKITVTSCDLNTKIVGTISQITKYGLYTFDLRNEYGISSHSPSGTAAGLDKVQIFLKKPSLIVSSVSPSSPGEYGAIFKFYATATDFNTSPGNKVNICGSSCTVLPTNLLVDTNNTFQCILNTPTPSANFTNCKPLVAYYGLNSEINLTNTISSNSLNNYNISKISINNVDIYSSLFTGIADSTNFQLQVQIISNNINLNLKMIVDNRYVYSATSPGVLATNNQAVYTFNLPNGLPAGSFQCAIHDDSSGFLRPNYPIYYGKSVISSFLLKINLKLNTPTVNVDSSFYGGVSHSIIGFNLNKQISPNTDISTEVMVSNSDNSAFHKILVCGFPAQVTQYNTRKITYLTPTIINYNFFKDLQILKDPEDLLSSKFSYITETVFDNSVKDPLATTTILTDENIFTKYDIPAISPSNIPFVGLRIKSAYQSTNLKILLQKIKIHVGETNKPGDFNDGYIEGSLDNSTWTKLTDMPKTLPFLWYTVTINYTNINNKLYKYFRFVANATYLTSIAEIKFLGNVVYDDSTSTTALCDVNVVDNYNNLVVPNVKVRYDTAKTLVIKSITPQNGTSVGGQTVKVTLASTFTVNSNTITSVSIFGNPITTPITYETQTSSRILQNSNTYNTVTFTMVSRNNDVFDSSLGIQIYIPGYGNVYSNGISFKYLDRWSDTNTWGGEFIPANGETAYIKNTDVLLDVPNLNINTLVIENGSLIVEDTRDYNITARNIMVRSGSLIIGTEESPFQHNLVITMKSTKTDPSLPIFGNKVIAILEGNLLLQGKPRKPTWTVLSKTVFNGENTITVDGAVDWKVGEEISIASSSVDPEQAERRTIVAITGGSSNNPVITLDRKLDHAHNGEIETYGTNDVIDMRTEVILLSRNIVIQGDEESVVYQYGSHMMITSMSMNMNPVFGTAPYWGKIAYVEFRRAGQAYQLGRYPIHFHMMGDVSGSYVRGCSIHDTFNRAITIHGVHNFLVEYNVIDAAMGHTMFIEDGVETNNIIRFNVIMRTRASYSLFNTDVNPASFWVTNPSNFFEGNRAAGSQFYGIWFELPPAPTGVSLGVKTCPRDYPLGMFKDNVAHSNHKYGFRIFPEYTPKSRPCTMNTDPNVVTVQAMFTSTTLYRNREKGFVTERIGNLLFNGFKLADNVLQSFEVSDLIHFSEGRTTIMNMFIVGRSNSKVPVMETLITQGFVTPRNDNYTVSDIRFYNFNDSNFALFSSCSRCEVAGPSTDSDARTIFFEKIKPDPNAVNMVHWNLPKRAIYRDLDGTLTGQKGPGWVTPYYPHLLVDGACKRDPKWDDGIVCDDTVQIRRVAFFEATPNIFTGQDLKILRVNSLDNVPISDLADNSKFSIMKFKEKKDPMFGWTIAFITGYNYLLSFGNVGLDFDSLSIERSKMWRNSDQPINFLFNYTARRDEYEVNYILNQTTFNATSLSLTPKNTTNVSTIAEINNLQNNNLPLGTFYNNVAKRHLYLRISGLNESRSSTKLVLKAIQCSNNDCGAAPPNDKPAENFIRRWSNPDDWPSKKKPIDGENVEILQEWNMILDEPTAKLNTLTINGILFFNNSVDNLVLSAYNILILKGRLDVGTPSDPFTKRANIQLLGDKFSMNLALSNDIKLPNKALANVGILSIFGEDRAPYKSRLLAKAERGVKKLLVEKGLKWRGGDEVVIATTTWNSNETERFTILSYSNTTGELVIGGILNYTHYGGPSPTILKDNPLNPPRNLDERAEVFMISRNVRISGSNEGWGCNVATTIFPTSNFTYAGKTNISNAEIVNCGQLDTEFGAIQFSKHNNKYSQSFINGVSLYDSVFSGINILDSKNVTINNTFIFQHTKYGVSVFSSSDIAINETYVINHKKRSFPEKLRLNKLTDINACFYICPDTICTNINFTNSTCAGSDLYGFFLDSYECRLDLTKNYNYHTSYASKIGMYFLNSNSKDCVKVGNAIAYNNYGAGFGSYTTAEDKYVENIILSNNLNGIGINTGTKKLNTKKQMKRVVIMGQNKDNPICLTGEACNLTAHNIWTFSKECKQTGFFFSVTTSGMGVNPPFTDKMYPVHHTMGDAQFGSFFEGSDVVFSNFEDQCDIPQQVITTNEFASDYTSIHNFKNLTLSRVLEDNLIVFTKPNPAWAGEPCGDFACTGPNNVILKITNFKKPQEVYSNSEIPPNPKWNGTRKVYINPFVTNSTSAADRPNITLSDNITMIPKFIDGIYPDCQVSNIWNSYICYSNRLFGMLIGENIEPESRDRQVTPVYITSLDLSDPFINKVNSFMDHECENGYPSHRRTARIPGIISLNKSYNYTFTGTPPKKFKIQLTDPDWDPNSGSNKQYYGASFLIKYTSPQTVLVHNFNSGTEYKSRQWKDGEVFNETTCGANKWTPVNNTFEFYITNSPDCVLQLSTVNSVQLSLRFDISVEDFYKKDGATSLIYNIAAVLGISPDQIRITNVLKGSTIALTQILQTSPSAATSSSDSSSSSTSSSSSSTSFKLLDLSNAVNVIVNGIKTGSLSVPAPILSMSYSLVVADNTTASSNNNTNSATGLIVSDGIIISLNNSGNSTSNSTIITTGGSTIIIFNNSYPYIPTNNNNNFNNPIPNPKIPISNNENSNMNLLWLLVIPVFLIVFGVIAWFAYRHLRLKKIEDMIKNEMMKIPQETGRVSPTRSNRKLTGELQTENLNFNNNKKNKNYKSLGVPSNVIIPDQINVKNSFAPLPLQSPATSNNQSFDEDVLKVKK